MHCVIFTGIQDPDVEKIYQKTHESIETMTRMFFTVAAQILLPFYIISMVIISIYTYITSDYSNESFRQMYPAS